jgi:hypothetical protein
VITLEDRASLPPDVALVGDRLRDEALDAEYPVSGSTPMFLELLETGLTLREVADTVADRFGEPVLRVRQDLVGLVFQLNRARLINIDAPDSPIARLSRWVAELLISARSGRRFPSLTRRYPIDRRNPASIAASIAAVVLSVKAPQWLTLGVVSLVAGILFGVLLLPILLGLEAALIATMVAHETGHALAARRWSRGCFLIASRLGPVAVVHPPGDRDAWSNAAGPVAGAACGLLLFGVGLATQSVLLSVGAIPAVLNLLGFTVLFRDGRQLVRNSWRVQ